LQLELLVLQERLQLERLPMRQQQELPLEQRK
jgi:hypothetical protein